MKGFGKLLVRLWATIIGLVLVFIILFSTGIVEAPIFLDVTREATYQVKGSADKSSTSTNTQTNSNNTNNSNSITISTTDSQSYADVNKVPSALNITLSGTYLSAYNSAVSSLASSDTKSRILIKVGLQILQSKTIKYEHALHCYSLNYKNSGGTQKTIYYNLKDCINRINLGNCIYTDCFGFVRLTHSIACYTINSTNPEKVTGLSGLYGYQGAYGGSTFSNLKSFKPGAVIYDCLTGSGTGERHVAMFLFNSGNYVTFMDQSGIHHGTMQNSSYIFCDETSKNCPYKFNKFRIYNY